MWAGQPHPNATAGFGQLVSYGAPVPPKNAVEAPFERQRRRINVISVCLCLLMPWVVFMVVFGLLSFNLHYERPGLCWFSVIVILLMVAFLGAFAWQAARKPSGSREPTWLVFLFASCLLAWILALILGLCNYGSNMLPHYTVVTLNTYANVDPGQISGTGVMDAGRLSFKVGTYIDKTKAIAFKNVDTYCVAPVTSTSTPLLTYDFWAAGVNCCSGEPGDFHCGEVDGFLQLGGGDRVLSSSEIKWFTLATQQAEAVYHLRVGHAIFFKNVADPLGQESSGMDHGVKFFCLWSLLFFGLQVFLVSLVVVVFSRSLN